MGYMGDEWERISLLFDILMADDLRQKELCPNL